MEEGEFSEVIPQQLLKLWDEWTTSSTLCTPNVLSSTGTSARVWKKVNSVKHVKISQPWRRTTKRLQLSLTPAKEKKKTRKNSRYFHEHQKSITTTSLHPPPPLLFSPFVARRKNYHSGPLSAHFVLSVYTRHPSY